MSDIDSRWIDIELPPSEMATGCMPREDMCGDSWDIYEKAVQPIPRDQWDTLAARRTSMDSFIGRIHNQGSEGSCVGQGTSKAFEILYAIERGTDAAVEMSGMSLYKQDGVGRTASSGANIGDALKAIAECGILPLDTSANRAKYKHVHPETGFRLALPDGWENTAKQFRITEWWDIASFDGLATALLLGLPVVYGRASHCVCGLRLVKKDGVWYVKYPNSWGDDWADKGCGYDSEPFLKRRMGVYGAFAPRVTIVA